MVTCHHGHFTNALSGLGCASSDTTGISGRNAYPRTRRDESYPGMPVHRTAFEFRARYGPLTACHAPLSGFRRIAQEATGSFGPNPHPRTRRDASYPGVPLGREDFEPVQRYAPPTTQVHHALASPQARTLQGDPRP
jgi:hypothetical protein